LDYRYRNLVVKFPVYLDEDPDWDFVAIRRNLAMRNRLFTLLYGAMFMLAVAAVAVAQDNGAQQPSARQQLQNIHAPESIDQELSRLTKDLQLTSEQQKQVRSLLQEHHDRIQSLLDKNPAASRQDLGPQIHAISDETHRQIHALLTDHQKELESAMQQRENNNQENRRTAPPPAASAKPPSPGS
jgi:ribosome recycling factor